MLRGDAPLLAALFALHPLRVESVAWVTERKDVLSGLFFMLTLGAYVRYVRGPFSVTGYLTVVLVFVLALMSKSMVGDAAVCVAVAGLLAIGAYAMGEGCDWREHRHGASRSVAE